VKKRSLGDRERGSCKHRINGLLNQFLSRQPSERGQKMTKISQKQPGIEPGNPENEFKVAFDVIDSVNFAEFHGF